MPEDAPSLRCSQRARADGVLPSGTAGVADRFAFVQMEPPWPSKVDDRPAIVSMREPGAETSARALWPVSRDASDAPTSLCFTRGPGPCSVLSGVEGGRPIPEGTRDILVCTHGSRDACCGTEGMKLVRELTAWAEHEPNVRLWRTSHLGGHRFAPTIVDLPAGDVWAYADPTIVTELLAGVPSPKLVRRHHRGWWGLGSPFEQAADTEAWAMLGSGWRPGRREGRVVTSSDEGAHTIVRLDCTRSDGTRTTVHAHVARRIRSQFVSCGTERLEAEYLVTDLEVEEA